MLYAGKYCPATFPEVRKLASKPNEDFEPLTVGYAAYQTWTGEGDAVVKPFKFKRHTPGDKDVVIRLVCCGVCHTDLHFVKNDLGNSQFPLVPGHELAGIVTWCGSKVTKFVVGDKACVGCFVDSCRECSACKAGEEQYCAKGMTSTYNSERMHGRSGPVDALPTKGGYSNQYVANEDYVIRVPSDYPLEKAGPVVCSAITMYDPLIHWNAGKGGKKVGIIGIGGLGAFGIKLAKALGNTVYAFTTNPKKIPKIKELGAEPIVSTDGDAVAAFTGTLDLILDTVSAKHELMTYLPLLAHDGTHVLIGLVTEPLTVFSPTLLFHRTAVTGSLIAGIRTTQECMDFCAKNKIYQETELVAMDKINDIFKKLESVNDSPVRYVLDIEKTMPKATDVEGDVAES